MPTMATATTPPTLPAVRISPGARHRHEHLLREHQQPRDQHQRVLTRTGVLGLLLVALAACGQPAPPPTSSDGPPAGRFKRIEPLPRIIPTARLVAQDPTGVRFEQVGQQYAIVWVMDGAVVQREPSLPIPWPKPLRIATSARSVHIRLADVPSPDRAFLTIIRQVDGAGVPAAATTVQRDCSQSGTIKCGEDVAAHAYDIDTSRFLDTAKHIAVQVFWYVSTEVRRQFNLPNDFVQITAIWLFTPQVE
jgi:hypothetical protein